MLPCFLNGCDDLMVVLRIFFFLFFCSMAYGGTYPVKLGEDKVLVVVQEGEGKKSFIHLHQNEITALKAAKIVSRTEGTGLLTLKHRGGRTIQFHLNHQRYEFDPNRIFTDKGIRDSLNLYSRYSPKAHREVKKLADEILKRMPQGKLIAVHNNMGYSIRDYLPGHPLEKDAKSLHLTAKQSYRNFYLMTQDEDYQRLVNKGLNGILQAKTAQDDGSLSVLYANKSYINVEAGYDQLAMQIKMLKWA